jgi:hypothetical protein
LDPKVACPVEQEMLRAGKRRPSRCKLLALLLPFCCGVPGGTLGGGRKGIGGGLLLIHKNEVGSELVISFCNQSSRLEAQFQGFHMSSPAIHPSTPRDE